MTAITTPEAVLAATGRTVTAEEIAIATSIVGLLTGVDFEVDPLPYLKRDVRRLREAVVWQSPYVSANPELAEQAGNLAAASVNGVSVTYREGGSESAALLAPLARVALGRLSWRRSKSVPMIPSRRTPLRGQTLLIDGDDGEWRPLR